MPHQAQACRARGTQRGSQLRGLFGLLLTLLARFGRAQADAQAYWQVTFDWLDGAADAPRIVEHHAHPRILQAGLQQLTTRFADKVQAIVDIDVPRADGQLIHDELAVGIGLRHRCAASWQQQLGTPSNAVIGDCHRGSRYWLTVRIHDAPAQAHAGIQRNGRPGALLAAKGGRCWSVVRRIARGAHDQARHARLQLGEGVSTSRIGGGLVHLDVVTLEQVRFRVERNLHPTIRGAGEHACTRNGLTGAREHTADQARAASRQFRLRRGRGRRRRTFVHAPVHGGRAAALHSIQSRCRGRHILVQADAVRTSRAHRSTCSVVQQPAHES